MNQLVYSLEILEWLVVLICFVSYHSRLEFNVIDRLTEISSINC
jgi:hypothetical protein